jgi:TPR repeat protein
VKALVVLLALLSMISLSLERVSAVSPDDIPTGLPQNDSQKTSPPSDQPAAPTAPQKEQTIAELRQALRALKNQHNGASPQPLLAEAYLEIGLALIETGNLPGAITELREALRLQPDSIPIRAGLGLTLYHMGDVDSAIEEYRVVLRLQPDLAQAHLDLARALMAKHDWAAARAELQSALQLQPDLVEGHYHLGVVRYTMGDLRGAIEAYRQALRLNPDYADAHYNLGLMLKLANRPADAVQELLAAARTGLPKAQYFLGTAYASGHGVERNLAVAIKWWSLAAEQGMTQAGESLAQQRQLALFKTKHSPAETQAAVEAFKSFRTTIAQEFPDLHVNAAEESVGVSLVRQGRSQEAVPVLIREAYALSEPAEAQLETLYEHGTAGQLNIYDARILAYFKTTAAEGLPRSRIVLARIYAKGLGVPQDLTKAGSLLKDNPNEDAQRLLKEISAASPAMPKTVAP